MSQNLPAEKPKGVVDTFLDTCGTLVGGIFGAFFGGWSNSEEKPAPTPSK